MENQSNITLKKMHKRLIYCFIIIAFLSAGLLCSIIMLNRQYARLASSSIALGEDVQINISSNNVSVCPVSFSGAVIPDSAFEQKITIYNTEIHIPLYIRAKAEIVKASGDKTPAVVQTYPNWVFGEDGYYYLTTTLIQQSKMAFSGYVYLPQSEELSLLSSKVYQLNFIFESLQDKDDINSLWISAPEDWRNSI